MKEKKEAVKKQRVKEEIILQIDCSNCGGVATCYNEFGNHPTKLSEVSYFSCPRCMAKDIPIRKKKLCPCCNSEVNI